MNASQLPPLLPLTVLLCLPLVTHETKKRKKTYKAATKTKKQGRGPHTDAPDQFWV